MSREIVNAESQHMITFSTASHTAMNVYMCLQIHVALVYMNLNMSLLEQLVILGHPVLKTKADTRCVF